MQKKYLWISFYIFASLLLMSPPLFADNNNSQISHQKAIELVQTFHSALYEQHNLNNALSCLADNVVFTNVYGDIFVGKEQVSRFLKELIDLHVEGPEIGLPEAEGKSVVVIIKASLDSWQNLDVKKLDLLEKFIVENDKIVYISVAALPKSWKKFNKESLLPR